MIARVDEEHEEPATKQNRSTWRILYVEQHAQGEQHSQKEQYGQIEQHAEDYPPGLSCLSTRAVCMWVKGELRSACLG
jgi:hypothetical protein